MRRLFAVLIVLAILGTLAPAPVAAAHGNASGNATTTTATSTTTPPARGGHPVSIDGVATIQGWSFHNGVMNVTVKASQYHVVTLSGSASATGQVAHPAYRRLIMHHGETKTITIPADRVNGRAKVSATTSACIQAGSCPTVETQSNTGPWLTGGSTVGWLGGAFAAVVVFFVTGYLALRSTGGDPEVA